MTRLLLRVGSGGRAQRANGSSRSAPVTDAPNLRCSMRVWPGLISTHHACLQRMYVRVESYTDS